MGVRLGVRVVCVDRPGFGWSGMVGGEEEGVWRGEMMGEGSKEGGRGEGARLLGLVRDVEEVAGVLGVERFGVMVSLLPFFVFLLCKKEEGRVI